MELEEREETGFIKVEWSADPYGTVIMNAHYWLYQKGSENFLSELDFAKEHFQQLYDRFLEYLFDLYNKNMKIDVWDEKTSQSERIDFSKKEEMHPYLGMEPFIDIMSYKGRVLIGLSFNNHNRISIEHGLCAVFDKLDLICMDSYNFEGIIDNFQYEYPDGF